MEASRKLAVYRVEEGEVVFDIDKNEQTIWATQEEISTIFGVDRTVVGRHLRNIFKTGELEEGRVCAKNARTARDGKVYQTKYYNLDAIISVGYRVNSKKATNFRVWATGVLRKYITQGVAVNEKRLEQLGKEKLEELEGALTVVKRLIGKTELGEGEAKGILEVIARYGGSLETIREFGEGHISFKKETSGRMRRSLTIGDAANLVENLREETNEGEEFGKFRSERGEKRWEEEILGLNEEGTGKTVAEKAVRLLYFLVKEKPFLDGNRRIGALLFIYFLTINDYHLAGNGETKISDRGLVAITLLIAESEEKEKELIISLVEKLLED